jgi:acylphosphatase
MDSCCVKALVTGKVQGVWYRRATQEQALRAGVTGHARNLPDGRVEVLMCGERGAVRRLGEWLWRGPENARVTHVVLEAIEAHPPDDFRTL